MNIPEFRTKKELFDHLVKNEAVIAAERNKANKETDSVVAMPALLKVETANKAALKEGEILVKVAINTTNILDSHLDVHIPGLWKKTLRESKRKLMHLQEHRMKFDAVIADYNDIRAYTETLSFKDLGYDIEGDTQALIFESVVKRDRNPFMYDQYLNGYVRQHSVGMRYVKYTVCINDEDYEVQYENWEKYFPQVANKEEAEKAGFFWAVTEAKLIEGSAVLSGSNSVTPTLEITDKRAQKHEQAVKSTLVDEIHSALGAAERHRGSVYDELLSELS